MIGSAFFYFFWFLLTLIFGTLSLFLWPLSRRNRYGIVKYWAQSVTLLLRFCCGLSYQITGQENMPKNQGYIVISNHQSVWETLVFQKIFQWPVFLLKRELLWIPFFGYGLAMTWPIKIDRSKRGNALKTLLFEGKKRLENGANVIIFPEGTRIKPEEIGEFKSGGVLLAKKCNVTIVPVFHNAGTFWGKNSFFKKKGCVSVVIGKPIDSSDIPVRDLTSQLQDWMHEQQDKLMRQK